MYKLEILKNYIKTFIKYHSLLKELVVRDIKVKYKSSILGMLWTVMNPLLMMMVLTIVFSHLFKMNIKNFPVYILVGNIIFNFNAEASTQGLNAIVWNAPLIKKVYIPKYLFPLASVTSGLVNFAFSFVALIIVMIFTKAQFHVTILTIWIPLLYLFMFTLGLSLILCTLNIFFRDIQHLYSVVVTAWVYLTPLFYSIDIVPEHIRSLIMLNPLYHFVAFFRQIIMQGTFPSIQSNFLCGGMGLGMLVLGLLIFKSKQDKFILHI